MVGLIDYWTALGKGPFGPLHRGVIIAGEGGMAKKQKFTICPIGEHETHTQPSSRQPVHIIVLGTCSLATNKEPR